MFSPMTSTNIKLSSLILSLALLAAGSPAMAKDAPAPDLQAPNTGNSETQPAGEMVNPSDRNFQALQQINNRYQCGVSTSQEPVSRSAFSKNVEVCLNSLEAKLAQSPNAASKEDLQQLNELATTYRQEMAALNDRVEKVETKLAQNKETNTFSPNTKLVGEIIFALSGYGSDPSGTIFSDRIRLNFDTSFTGKDRLRARIQARNTTPFGTATTGTNTTRLGFDGSEDNSASISLLQYKMPLGDKANIILETVGSEYNENMYTFNPLLSSGGGGSISRFGRFNPIYRLSGDGAAVTGDYKLSDKITASVGYAVPGTASANPATGAFGSSNSFIGQLRFEASPNIDLGLAYARSYNANGAGLTGSTGTAFANNPFSGAPTSANHYSAMASAKLSPGFVLSGWAGLANARAENGTGDTANLFNYAVSAAFPDFGAKGNVLGFTVGSPPKVTGGTVAARVDTANPLHLEAIYKVKLNDNVDVTPGLLLITNPDTATGATEYAGTIRTTFKF